mmetsp:Transcript_10829/g.25838  ORF Transcript_10829/g.25838 Transcript_10829/m.25838 type:complete len:414 (+) Transcript_10829:150-1391(+)
MENSSNTIDNNMDNMTEADRNVAAENQSIWKFCITGGPCGGKTTALARIYSFLKDRGFEVCTAPETYGILASNGMSMDFYSTDGMASFIQNSVLDVQIALEDSLVRVLKARGGKGVLLCDRGGMDGAAYLDDEGWQKVLRERNVCETDLRDSRYNAVFHLVTAADGAEKFYTLENNQVRRENVEEARVVDQQTQKVWTGHPSLYLLDNSTDFEGKMQRLISIVAKHVGLPSNLSKRSAKYLLRGVPDMKDFTVEYHMFEVEKVYLKVSDTLEDGDNDSAGSYSFIRKRTTLDKNGEKGGSVYQITEVTKKNSGEETELKRIISGREYTAAYKSRDLSRHVIRQMRINFLYKKQSFAIHFYQTPSTGLCIIHAQVESTDGDAPVVNLPPFLDVERQLQGKQDEDSYGSYALSLL